VITEGQVDRAVEQFATALAVWSSFRRALRKRALT
jgi:hypothetical protein